MGSVPISLVPPGSIDRWGLSIVTAARTASDARLGTVYDPKRFAAAVPVYFHPLSGSRFLGLFNDYWTDATPVSGEPGVYSAHAVVHESAFAVIDASTGQCSIAKGFSDFGIGVQSRFLGACSNSHLLYTLMESGMGEQRVQPFRIEPDDTITAMGSTPVPENDDVIYSRGIYLDGPFLYLWGSADDGTVYTARVFTSRLGVDPWAFQTDTGWTDRDLLDDDDEPILAIDQATPVKGLKTVGPMSTVVVRKRTYVTTVELETGDYVGRIWASRSMGDPWVEETHKLIDGSVAWMENGLMLQPQVTVNYDILAPESAGAVPYCTAYAIETEDGEGVFVFWDLLQIPR